MDKFVETKIKENKNEEGIVVERVIENWQEKVPMELVNRVTEKIAPVVLERTTEVYEEDNLVSKVVELVDGTDLKAAVEPETCKCSNCKCSNNQKVNLFENIVPSVDNSFLDKVFYVVAYSLIAIEIAWLIHKTVPLFQ